jgi:uncharacterized cupredoxin-like copper-binding protein
MNLKSILSISVLLATLSTPWVHAAGKHSGGHAGEPGKASDVSRTIEVTMFDNYYEPENFSIKAGETVRFIVKNKGAMVHEFNIGTAEMHLKHQKEMMMMVEHGVLEVDRINKEAMKKDMGMGHGPMTHDDPNSVLLEPGKQGEIIWKFKDKVALEIACNIPGHYESGMVISKIKFN